MAKVALDLQFESSGLDRCGGAYGAVSAGAPKRFAKAETADSVPFSGGDAN
jgi:hypothetical protein